jgi:hypothetical protein
LSAGGEANLMVVTAQCREVDVGADIDVSEESETRIRRRLLEYPGHLLDFLVVWRHPESYQAERRGEPLIHVDLDAGSQAFEEILRDIKSRRAGTDHSDA